MLMFIFRDGIANDGFEKNEESRMISDKGANESDSPMKKSILCDDKQNDNKSVSN